MEGCFSSRAATLPLRIVREWVTTRPLVVPGRNQNRLDRYPIQNRLGRYLNQMIPDPHLSRASFDPRLSRKVSKAA
jgi:hypothetical protein